MPNVRETMQLQTNPNPNPNIQSYVGLSDDQTFQLWALVTVRHMSSIAARYLLKPGELQQVGAVTHVVRLVSCTHHHLQSSHRQHQVSPARHRGTRRRTSRMRQHASHCKQPGARETPGRRSWTMMTDHHHTRRHHDDSHK